MSGLSLYAIERALLDLLEAREEVMAGEQTPDTPAELEQIEKALEEYVRAEVRKCDGIHQYLTAAKLTAEAARAEARRYEERARRIEGSMARLKELCCTVMEMAEVKRIDGTAGRYLLRKGNGGVAPLVIQEGILEDTWRDVIVRMPARWWAWLNNKLHDYEKPEPSCVRVLATEPANERIRRWLATREPIPGARLGERGEHLEVK